ncbi:MAG: histidine kinase, partial [Bacteroidetes bacterium]|nr:histidine kinase [Bacteroidota bacterium]
LYIQYRVPGLQRTRRRLVYLLIAAIVISHFGFALRFIAHYLVDGMPWKWPTMLGYTGATGVVIFYTCITIFLYEGAYLWQQGKQTMAEKEALIRLEWQTKYDLLKSKINPHFLFNSLNSLSSLIAEDPDKAEEFVDGMSKVYRYLLRSNDSELVTLETELQFIRSYCDLLSTRYGNAFRLVTKVDERHLGYLIPPLTLQLLVENAAKHNMVLKDRPLTVTIKSAENDRLTVANNIQRKKTLVLSNGVGLDNINTKYKMLSHGLISITKTEEQFTVSIPLIKNTAAETVSLV